MVDGSGTEVDADTAMAKPGQPLCVEARTATQVQNPPGLPVQAGLVDPCHLSVDNRLTPTGHIVLLGQVLPKHADAEIRIIPGDLLPFGPGFRWSLPINEVSQIHDGSILSPLHFPGNRR